MNKPITREKNEKYFHHTRRQQTPYLNVSYARLAFLLSQSAFAL
jgi:hypothetical protein